MGASVATEMSAEFRAQMRRLLGLKFAPANLQTHWESLHDLPDALLQSAVDHAQRMCDEFPSPHELRTFAERMRFKVLPVPPPVDRSMPSERVITAELPGGGKIRIRREWKYYCDECSDSGWVSIWCDGYTRSDDESFPAGRRSQRTERAEMCSRTEAHGSHEWTMPCPCAATNPDVLRRRERERQVKRGKDDE